MARIGESASRTLRFAWATLLDLVYPPVCVGCRGRHDSSSGMPLCEECRRNIVFIGDRACPRCGQWLGPHTAGRRACPTEHKGLLFRRAVAVCRYHSMAQRIVKAFKFGRDMRALEVMGPLLAERVARWRFIGEIDVVVPVPLHWRRRAFRRFNQSELIAERISERAGKDLERRAFRRIRYTAPQSTLAARERSANIRGAFEAPERGAFRGERILLVDDVMTTCSTARECARTLLDAGARSVDVAVFAR